MPFVNEEPASWIFGVPFVSYTTCATVMMFCVNVPVLSEQIQDVEPSVSTPARVDGVVFCGDGAPSPRRVAWYCSPGPRHAIAATAYSRTRRDGPDVFQRLKIEEQTTHDLV